VPLSLDPLKHVEFPTAASRFLNGASSIFASLYKYLSADNISWLLAESAIIAFKGDAQFPGASYFTILSELRQAMILVLAVIDPSACIAFFDDIDVRVRVRASMHYIHHFKTEKWVGKAYDDSHAFNRLLLTQAQNSDDESMLLNPVYQAVALSNGVEPLIFNYT